MKKWLIALTSFLTFTSSAFITTISNNTIIQTENQNINVNISAYDENNQQIINLHYQTKFDTLGELMAQEKNTYLLKDFGAPLGLYLYGINYYDNQGNKQTKLEDFGNTFWAFWYINDEGNEEFSPVGISSYYLTHTTENIIWRYTDVEKNWI